MDDPTIPSIVDPPQADEPALKSSVQDGAGAKSSTPDATADSPPTPPVARTRKEYRTAGSAGPDWNDTGKDAAKAGATAPAAAKPAAPTAPSGDSNEPKLERAPDDKTASTRRDTLRPIYPITRTLRPELRNVLVGRVESDSGEPLGEVPVSVTRADNTSIRRVGHDQRIWHIRDPSHGRRLDRQREDAERPCTMPFGRSRSAMGKSSIIRKAAKSET